LIQRVIEEAGIATVSITFRREITELVKPPRALYLKFSPGKPLGNPGDKTMQMAIIHDALGALKAVRRPGTIIDLPYSLRRLGFI
jgi:D-proline reductase (dithiol) PrdB